MRATLACMKLSFFARTPRLTSRLGPICILCSITGMAGLSACEGGSEDVGQSGGEGGEPDASGGADSGGGMNSSGGAVGSGGVRTGGEGGVHQGGFGGEAGGTGLECASVSFETLCKDAEVPEDPFSEFVCLTYRPNVPVSVVHELRKGCGRGYWRLSYPVKETEVVWELDSEDVVGCSENDGDGYGCEAAGETFDCPDAEVYYCHAPADLEGWGGARATGR